MSNTCDFTEGSCTLTGYLVSSCQAHSHQVRFENEEKRRWTWSNSKLYCRSIKFNVINWVFSQVFSLPESCFNQKKKKKLSSPDLEHFHATDPSLKFGVVYELTCNDCDLTCMSMKLLGISGNAWVNTELACAMIIPEVSAAAEYMLSYDHHLDWEHPRIIEKTQASTICRRIKEALAIHTRTTMNRDKGLELSKLWLNLV